MVYAERERGRRIRFKLYAFRFEIELKSIGSEIIDEVVGITLIQPMVEFVE